MLMWVMSDRAIPRSASASMEGFGVHTFRLPRRRAGASTLRASSTGSPWQGVQSVVWDESREDQRCRSPTSTGATCGTRSRQGSYPRMGARRATVRPTKFAEARSSFDVLDPTKLIPEELDPGDDPSASMVLEPDGRQLLRRDRAGRVRHREPDPRHRHQQRPAAARTPPLLPRHPAQPPRRPELPRDPDQRGGGAGPQQPARRHPSPGHPARPRRLRAELTRRAAVRSRPA